MIGVISMNAETENVNQVARVAKLAAELMLKNGAETYRAEETARHICRAFGYDSDVIAFPTGLLLQIGADKAMIARVSKRDVDFIKIERVNEISRALASGKVALSEAEARLCAINAQRGWSLLLSSLIAAGSSAMFALMFLGGLFDIAAAGACAFIAQAAVVKLDQEAGMSLVSLAGGFLTAMSAILLTVIFKTGDVDKIIISALMPLLPGLAMTNAIRDAMRGDLVSGVSRAGEALIRAIVLAAGAGLSISAWMLLGGGAQ
jgi:uncharacterized membrane protein YjjP (DUF1212 family)